MSCWTGTAPDNLHYFCRCGGVYRHSIVVAARTPRYIVLNADDENFAELQRSDRRRAKISYGANESADCRIRQVKPYKRLRGAAIDRPSHDARAFGTAFTWSPMSQHDRGGDGGISDVHQTRGDPRRHRQS